MRTYFWVELSGVSSSVVERPSYTRVVVGSIPTSRTRGKLLSMSLVERSEEASLLLLQSMVRMAVYGLLLCVFSFRYYFELFNYEPTEVIVLGLILFVGSVGLCFMSRRVSDSIASTLLSIAYAGEIALVTLMVYFSGGIESRVVVLYALPIVLGISTSFRAALAVGIAVLTGYFAILLADWLQLLPAIERGVYTAAQTATLQVIRIVILEIILFLGGLLIVTWASRRANHLVQERETALFEVTHALQEPLLKAREALSLPSRLLDDNERLNTQQKIDSALATADKIVGALQQEPITLVAVMNFLPGKNCVACSRPIGLLERYWGIPRMRRMAQAFGECRNDIHCHECHEAEMSCNTCEAWS